MSATSGRIGGVAGIAAAVLLAAGLAALPGFPSPEADAQQVFAFFLDEDTRIRAGAALQVGGMLAAAGLLSTIRVLVAERGAPAVGGALFTFGLLGIGTQAFALATLLAAEIGAEDADPATSRALLDLFEIGTAISGIAFALMLASCVGGLRRIPGVPPYRLAQLSAIAALGCLLWAARLFTDAGALAADSFAGSTLGWLLLLAWLAGCGHWLLTHRPGSAAVRGTPA